jgi:beta-N-acetylhexosaminidase
MSPVSRPGARAALAALLVVLLAAPAAVAQVPALPAAECEPLTIREQAAQVVMTGVAGYDAGAVSRELVADHAGAVILMGHNVRDVDQLRALTDDLRSHATHGLLVAVDEEGGRVARLGRQGAAPRIAPARELAARHTPAEVRAIAADLGEHLRAAGIDWNLAPVLDVTDAPANSFIGDRSWSSDPEVVTRYATAFAQGLADAGVMSAAKHFPGHGPATVDSHVTLAEAGADEELEARDLLPFHQMGADVDAVLTAHVLVPSIDPDRPASLSPEVMAVLRDDLGFEGLVITDALEMGAVAERWDVPEAAELAIAAGADMVMVARPGREASTMTDRIAAAVEDGRLSRGRLAEAAGRVLAAKGQPPAAVRCLLGLPPAASPAAQLKAVLDGSEQVLVSLALSKERYASGTADSVLLLPAQARATVDRAGDGPVLHLPGAEAPSRQAAVIEEVRRVLGPAGSIYVNPAVSARDLGPLAADARIRRAPTGAWRPR